MNNKPKFLDTFILSCFVIFITFQPYLLHHEIIMMESGIHSPAIQALFDGKVPYRDFFYLRGPLELYVPAFLMMIFGENMIWLPIFYYVGTVLTMIFAIMIAAQILRTRFVLYLMVPVFVARTFPRVCYYYWGGMRYALGMLALCFAVKAFKSKKASWSFGAGIISCLSFWTTIETGAATMIAIGGALILSFFFNLDDRPVIIKLFKYYIFGIIALFLPVAFYMGIKGALIPYIQMTHVVLTRSYVTFWNGPGISPVGITGYLNALLPNSRFFKVMTPIYFYVVLILYIFYRKRKRTFDMGIAVLICIAIYGIILYISGFRRLDGHHFEMALQPEKILLFFILEEFYLFVIKKRYEEIQRLKGVIANRWQGIFSRFPVYIANFLIIAFIGSSLGFAGTRFYRRFVMVKYMGNVVGLRHDRDLSLLHEVEKRKVNIDRAKGMVVPTWQADEMEGIVNFLEKNTDPGEVVFPYPEVGNFNFWANRPFVGKFPIATISWLTDEWQHELIEDFKKTNPKYVIMTNLGHRTFPEEWYFRNKANIRKFNAMTDLILDNYTPIKRYESVSLYQRNSSISRP